MTLKGRQDGFRILLPKDFIPEEIEEKYTKVLQAKHSFFTKPIDFLNETIQSIQVLGLENATIQQQQTSRGYPIRDDNRTDENNFLHTSSEYTYRSDVSPLSLIDKTVNIMFRHTLGFVNYFLLFETFFYHYSRDTKNDNLINQINVDILNSNGEVYSRVVLYNPIINSIDMLDLNYTQPVATSQTFKVEFKYSNFDYEFIETDNSEDTNKLTI